MDGTEPIWRQAGADAGAQDAAAPVGIQSANDLVAGALWIGEGIDPDVDPLLDVRKDLVKEGTTGHEEKQPEHDIRGAPRRDVEQSQEDHEVEQRSPEVLLNDDDEQGDAPHREHREQVRQRRQA